MRILNGKIINKMTRKILNSIMVNLIKKDFKKKYSISYLLFDSQYLIRWWRKEKILNKKLFTKSSNKRNLKNTRQNGGKKKQTPLE